MQYTISVTHEGRSYNADVQPQEKCDQLLLRSLHHFEIGPDAKGDWTLSRSDAEDPAKGELVLSQSIAGQLDNGDRVELRPRDQAVREPSTGTY